MASENVLVPFGKHKGEPVEVLLADKGLHPVAQPRFQARFPATSGKADSSCRLAWRDRTSPT